MALSRKLLKGMGLSDEQIDSVIDAHTETVDALKGQITALKADADRLPGLQKELDDLKGGEDWKARYEAEHKAFDDYKADAANKAQSARVQAAYRKLLKDASIDEKRHDAIVRVTDFSGMKLAENGELEGADQLSENIKKDWGAFAVTVQKQGADVDTPPKTDPGDKDPFEKGFDA